MLLYSEIAQLSDRDLADEIENARNSLFRQKMGVRTKHLKDTHLVKALRKYVAQLLTELRRRKQLGEKVAKTSSEVAKKTAEMHSAIEKAQTSKKKLASAKAEDEIKKSKKKVEEAEEADKKIEAKSSKDVKVKKVEKKGFFSRKKKTEQKVEKVEEVKKKIEAKSSQDVKVKKVEKKGLFKKVFSKKEKEKEEKIS